MLAVAAIVVAWGIAQWPYMLPTSLTVDQAAAPTSTLEAVLVVFAIAVVVIVPSIGLLFYLDQKTLLPEESVDTSPPRALITTGERNRT
jgi:cytochrome d ubiquinol oxidase subunit II